MATTPGITEDLAQNVAQIYANAETAVIEKLADYTAKGLEQPGWLADELVTVQKFRAQAQTIADDAKAKAMKAALTDADIAAQYGYQSAATEMGDKLAGQIKGKSPHAVTALAAQMHKTTTQATFDIVSSSQKAMHDVVLAASQPALLGVQTPQDAAQKALNVFADQGITSVTYAGKRKVRTEHYVEMAMRTGLMNAALEGHALKMREQGRDLIQVSDHSQECDSCRPYEGKVLSLSNQRGKLELPSAVGEGTATVYVFDTLSAAKAKGLFHPNCRHVFRAFIPGVSEEKFLYQTADPAGNDARVKQRYLERELRAARRAEAAAITPQAKAKAKARIKHRRDQLGAHIAQHNLKRQPARERITGQFKPVTPNPSPKMAQGAAPIAKTQLSGSFAPKAPAPEKKTQLTGSFEPKKAPEKKTQLSGSFDPKPPVTSKLDGDGAKVVAKPAPAGKPAKKGSLDAIKLPGKKAAAAPSKAAGKKAAPAKKSPAKAPAKKAAPAKKTAAPRTRAQPGVTDPNATVGSAARPRVFTDTEGHAFGARHTVQKNGAWPKAQLRAIKNYTGNGYKAINRKLWRTKGQEGGVKALDEAFKNDKLVKPTDEWIMSTRGTNIDEFGAKSLDDLDNLVDTEQRQDGYWSTSLNKKPAFGGQIQLFIRQPPGTRGLYVDGPKTNSAMGERLTVNPGESEWILPRGTKYRIIKVEKGTNGFSRNLIVEVVPE